MSQLRELAEPFKGGLVKEPPKGKFGQYVSHSTVNERALSVVGPHSFEIIEIIRNADDLVSGVLARLTVEIDGRRVVIVEAGDEEHPEGKRAGEAVKNASSDAYKRCWMRLGLGLHLWSQQDYFLPKQLDKLEKERNRQVTEIKDGAGNVVDRIDSETGERLPAEPIEGQATLDDERPFE